MYNKYIQAYLNLIFQSRKDNYYQQLLRAKNNYNQLLYTQEQAKDLSEILFSYNNPKKEKMTLWFLIKGTARLPQDQYKIDKAFNLVEKQHLNFQKYSTPQEIINRTDESTLRINAQDQDFNPDTQPTFSNKKALINGIVIYNVQDSKEGQLAVRKAIDVNWGYDANPWCLAARKQGFIQANRQQIQNMSQQQKQKIGLYDDNCLSIAWKHWSKRYTAYPKRIAFQNGKLLAFCANNVKEIQWWDRNDQPTLNIPGLQNEDDPEWYNIQYNAYKLAKDPNTPPEILQKLTNYKDWNIRVDVAINKNIPLEILIKLSNDENQHVRREIAKNTKIPSEILQKLANDEDYYIRQYVAKHPNASIDTLNKLANDEHYFVRIAVAKNLNTPSEILSKLANDNNLHIRQVVAKNPNTTTEILSKLANDKNQTVRANIAENPNTPLEILQKLINDDIVFVRDGIIWNPNISLNLLQILSKDKSSYIRSHIAKNPITPNYILQKLANDEKISVRQAIASNINTPINVLKKLITDIDSDVSNSAKVTLQKINNIKNN